MIYVKLTGGIGNQLFQYAAARQVQIRLKEKLCLDYSDMNKTGEFHNNSFINGLNKFKITYDEIIYSKKIFLSKTKTWGKKFYFYDNFLNLLRYCYPLNFELRQFVERRFQINFNRTGYFFVRDGYSPIYPENVLSSDCVLKGFWQSELYYSDIIEELSNEIVFNSNYIQEKNIKFIGLLKRPDSVCCHIRRGDYATGGRVICDEKYFLKCFDIFNKNFEKVFYIFSDDINWVKKNMNFKNYNIVFMDRTSSFCEDLQLFSLSKNFILSNSTFSYWGQFMQKEKNKIVLIPKPWLKKIPTQIYQKEWIQVSIYE